MYTPMIDATEYKGLPLSPDFSGYVGVYLDDAIDTVKAAMNGNSYVITCHMFIKIRSAYLGGLVLDSGNRVRRMIAMLIEQVEITLISNGSEEEGNYKQKIDAIWNTEHVGDACVHHLVLILSPKAYFNQHTSREPEQVIKDRILMAWCKVNHMPLAKGFGQIVFASDFINKFQADESGMKALFPKISMLCTYSDTQYGCVVSPFGSTRGVSRYSSR